VPLVEILLLILAGVGGGLAGSVAGLASVVSYPALLATGLGAVEANVTNTVALVFSSLGSVTASRPELAGQWPDVRRLALAATAGGAAGAALLLVTDPDTFERLAPLLIAGASLAILLRPRPEAHPAERPRTSRPDVVAAVFCVGIYGGYFGAAAGVILLALFLRAGRDTLARSNALKNVVLGVANGTAAIGFALLGPVEWEVIPPLAVGLLAGARLGPVIVRRSDARLLRTLIGLAGLALAVKLGVDAY
jgi:uncharacterized membrane protein YfcA